MKIEDFEKIEKIDNCFDNCVEFEEKNYSKMDLNQKCKILINNELVLQELNSFEDFDFRISKNSYDFILINSNLKDCSFRNLNFSRGICNSVVNNYIQHDVIEDKYSFLKIEGINIFILFETEIIEFEGKKAVIFKHIGEEHYCFFQKKRNDGTIARKEELRDPIVAGNVISEKIEVVKKKVQKYTREELDDMYKEIIRRSEKLTLLRSKAMTEYDQNEKEKIKKEIKSFESELKSLKGVYDYNAKKTGIKKPFCVNEKKVQNPTEKQFFVSRHAISEGFGKIEKIKGEIKELKNQLQFARSMECRKDIQKNIDKKNQELGGEEEKYKSLIKINKNGK